MFIQGFCGGKMRLSNKPKITVIMSVYNTEKYVAQAIESILNQTFTNFEFIIFDDGSTDRSREIIERYAIRDKRIISVYNNKNKGYVGFIKNLNRGLKMARGRYIARMDADDISLPDRLSKEYRYLEENPDLFLTASSYKIIDEYGNEVGKTIWDISPDEMEEKLLKKSPILHPTIMFRRDSSISYRLKSLYCEDYDLYLRLITLKKKMTVIRDILVCYRVSPVSVSSQNLTRQAKFIENMKRFYFERKNGKKESYGLFNPKLILSEFKEKQNQSIDERYVKMLFKNNRMFDVRKNILILNKRHGFKPWTLVYYSVSFIPIAMLNFIRRIIWR
jgi:glycosyltransferase involved in cell wall biosynthesis